MFFGVLNFIFSGFFPSFFPFFFFFFFFFLFYFWFSFVVLKKKISLVSFSLLFEMVFY
jgi:hypothetical protein